MGEFFFLKREGMGELAKNRVIGGLVNSASKKISTPKVVRQ